jgi:hypothetical protein
VEGQFALMATKVREQTLGQRFMWRVVGRNKLMFLSGIAILGTTAQSVWAVPVSAVPPRAVHAAEMNPIILGVEATVVLAVIAIVGLKRRRSGHRSSIKS